MPVRFFSSRGIYYGWVVIGVVFTTLFAVMGIRFAFGVFYVAILAETGWSRAETAGIFSTAMAVYALTVIVSGALFDRLGPRRLFPMAILALGVGLILCSTITSIWQFYLYYGVIIGVSYSLLGFPTHMAVVPRWFVKRRGLAAAIALSGTGFGSLIIALLSERAIAWIGWRNTCWLYGVLAIVLLIPLTALLYRNSPEELGQHPDGRPPATPPAVPAGQQGFTVALAVRTPAWWLLLLAVFMIGFMNMTMVVHQTQLSLDLGYNLATASGLFGLTGLTRSVGALTWGPLSDRIGRKRCFVLTSAFGVVGVLMLLLARVSPQFVFLLGFAVLFGFGFMGMAAVYGATVADLFPGRHLGKILCLLDIGFGMGSSGGPWLAGYLFDRYGTYDVVMFMMMAGAAITGTALTLAAGHKPVLRA